MKCIILLLCFVVSSFAAIQLSDQKLQQLWDQFKQKFDKVYPTEEEDAKRMDIFAMNLEEIINHKIEYDLGNQNYRKAINKFSDLTQEEFANILLRLTQTDVPVITDTSQAMSVDSSSALPKQIDWRTQGLVTAVQDQGYCGSCYAFSAVASLEGQNTKKSGTLVKLSEQQILDCSTAEGNGGCDGGLMDFSFEYIKNNGGIDDSACYPYVAVQNNCTFRPECVSATVSGYVHVQSNSETALQQATATIGPISVGVAASTWQSYSGGIFDNPNCGTSLNHAVTVVGYGIANGVQYWIAKNSWGANWGEKGYIRLSRNKGNQCGIASLASYPLV